MLRGSQSSPGIIDLKVDVTDVRRGIFCVDETVPARAGPMTIFHPKWLPGYHAPEGKIELLAALAIFAGNIRLAWRRDPVAIHAFHFEVPRNVPEIRVRFQYLSPTDSEQGRVICTPRILSLQWSSVVLFPAGPAARRIAVRASATLPEAWQFACALQPQKRTGNAMQFKPVTLDVLIDSPLLAGANFRRIRLDPEDKVRLNIASDGAAGSRLSASDIRSYRALVRQADRLFGGRPFKRFDFLMALSNHLGGFGLEHRDSCEIAAAGSYFARPRRHLTERDMLAHEYVHAWNGKFRHGKDSRTRDFEQPIRNSLMWVYEGLTQYWSQVLTARAGLWTRQQALDAIACMAARCDHVPGRRWRALADTTRDPMIAGTKALPWPSWQRSEDYYWDGQMIWLEVDTLIRERSGDKRSLDDFARAFFGTRQSDSYVFRDVACALETLAPFDWSAYFHRRIDDLATKAPIDGIARGGYRLVYRKTQNSFHNSADRLAGTVDLTCSLGVKLCDDGAVSEVIWGGPCFAAGLTIGTKLRTVNGKPYSSDALKAAVADGAPKLGVEALGRRRSVTVDYTAGHRYPHLEAAQRSRSLDAILAAR
jgi:predicted metalloprotease with PDZ domain